MYFVNMTDTSDVLMTRGNSGAIPVVMGGDDCNGKIMVRTGKAIGFVNPGQGDDLFIKGLTPESGNSADGYLPKFTKLTYRDIADTEENAVILVFCKSVSIFEGIPAGFKYLYMGEDGILAALIYGACQFDGVSLQRCDNHNLSEAKVCRTFTGKDFKTIVRCEDKDSGYDYTWDVVSQVHIIEKADKKGEVTFSCSRVKDFEYNFNEEPLKLAREKYEARVAAKKKAEEERKAKLQQQAEELAKRRQAEKELEEERLAMRAKSAKTPKASKMKSSAELSGSQGAQAFLAAIGMLK